MALPSSYLPWIQAPADGILDFLTALSWKKPIGGSAGRDVAALMIYIVMLYLRIERAVDDQSNVPAPLEELLLPKATSEQIAEVSYDELSHLTGLSRSLINQGLQRLISLRKITATGSNQKRIYVLDWPAGRWYKLPCRAILGKNGVAAFKTFTLRSKHELHALKLYLYLASIRDSVQIYSEVSYELIFKRIGVSERDIRQAINVLIAAGLLARVHRETDRLASSWGPNQYYLTGYVDFIKRIPQPLIPS
jgi:hypothetical protein